MTDASTVRVSFDVSAIPDHPAGGGRYVIEVSRALAARGDITLTAIARRADGARWRALPHVNVVERAPARRPVRLAWEQTSLPRLLGGLEVDVHHAPHYTMPERASLPTVVTIHDVTFFEHPEWHERVKAPFFRRAIRVAAKKADALVCVSTVTAQRLDSVLSPKASVHVIPHGVDHARFRPRVEADDDEQLASIGVRPPYIAFIGTLEPRKDVPTLVRAFDRMASTHADLTLVVGGQDGWGTDEVAAAISHAAHRDRIRRVGYVPEPAVPALLRQAAAVAYPSLDEGFGLPALEALACGAPLVTTEGTAMAEVTAGAALLVRPGDDTALADALESTVAGGHDVDKRSGAGLEVAAAYTWERSADAHVEVYRSLL